MLPRTASRLVQVPGRVAERSPLLHLPLCLGSWSHSGRPTLAPTYLTGAAGLGSCGRLVFLGGLFYTSVSFCVFFFHSSVVVETPGQNPPCSFLPFRPALRGFPGKQQEGSKVRRGRAGLPEHPPAELWELGCSREGLSKVTAAQLGSLRWQEQGCSSVSHCSSQREGQECH